MADWPPLAVYSFVVLATVLENFVPPAPADAIVTLAAFLTQHGRTNPIAVFAAAWGGSAFGAVAIYYTARRFGRKFFASRIGRRLLTPESIASMEREYLRFGMIGVFFVRLLPGLRSVVAPFAGLVALSPFRALVPMIVASGLWYGLLTTIGYRLGAEWEAIKRLLAGLNTSLGILAVLVSVGLVIWFLTRRRRRRRERLWEAFHQAFQGDPAGESLSREDPAVAAVAVLLVQLARSDQSLDPEERDRIIAYVREHWKFGDAPGDPDSDPLDPAEFARVLTGRYEHTRRVLLVRRLWWHGFRDGLLRGQEERVMRRAATLLGLTEDDLNEARRSSPDP